jgi:branched-chain amino acid aminotransferase
MEIPYTIEELGAATRKLVRTNGLASCYIRPIAFYGYGGLGVAPAENSVETVIMSWPWAAYLGDGSLQNGITAKISTWKRIGPNVIPHAAKATGIYLNSMMGTTEARRGGYEEAILLTEEGLVADGPGENVFVVKDGVVRTPSLSTSILPGVTRDSVFDIARSLGYAVEEARLIRTDLYLADEVFMTGTAAEVTPIRAVDDIEIGVGPVTRQIQSAYLAAVTGDEDRWAVWRDHVVDGAR